FQQEFAVLILPPNFEINRTFISEISLKNDRKGIRGLLNRRNGGVTFPCMLQRTVDKKFAGRIAAVGCATKLIAKATLGRIRLFVLMTTYKCGQREYRCQSG